jgi:hypothetical protein
METLDTTTAASPGNWANYPEKENLNGENHANDKF